MFEPDYVIDAVRATIQARRRTTTNAAQRVTRQNLRDAPQSVVVRRPDRPARAGLSMGLRTSPAAYGLVVLA